MKIEKNDMVMVYDGGGTVPHCKYTGRFGDLTAYWQEIVSDAVYLFRLGESEECDWLVDALIDFVETGDGLKARFLTGFAACLAADRKSVENRGFGVAVRKVQCHRGEDGTVRVSSVETMHERRYTVDDWRYDTAHREQTENGQKG